MGEIRNQVDQAIAGTSFSSNQDVTRPQFLDPDSPGYGKPKAVNVSDEMTAIRDSIGGLITAMRIVADHLDAH